MEVAYLMIDGLWLDKWYVLMVYRQCKELFILHISVSGRESSSRIEKDLKLLKEFGYRFTGIVSDGGKGIESAVDLVYPHIPHQRCLAHAHRQMVSALGKHAREYHLQELRQLADHVWLIESKEALIWWQGRVKEWIKSNWNYLQEERRDDQGRWWRVHKGARKVVRIMLKIPKVSFVFLYGHPLMPKTTNELEGQLNHVVHRWLSHRGLKKDRWEDFLKWFVYFYNLHKLSDKKQKSV